MEQDNLAPRTIKAICSSSDRDSIAGFRMSYFEWLQNRGGLYWSLEDVDRRLKANTIEETDKIWQVASDLKIPMRTAAYVHALRRLGEALEAKGTRNYFVG
jgi:glutamate dehydrogenase (NADP+)